MEKTIIKKAMVGLAAALLASLAGCNQPEAFDDIEGFRKFMAGTWKADNSTWEFTFAPDGNLSSFHNNLDVQIVVKEGGGLKKVDDNTKLEYSIGPCQAKYVPDTGNLAVTIVTELYVLEFPNGALQGSSTDTFSGKVSRQDKTWNAKWTFRDKLIGFDSGSQKDPVTRELIFKKLPPPK